MEAVQRFLLILTLYCIMIATTFGQSTSPATRELHYIQLNIEYSEDVMGTLFRNSTVTLTEYGKQLTRCYFNNTQNMTAIETNTYIQVNATDILVVNTMTLNIIFLRNSLVATSLNQNTFVDLEFYLEQNGTLVLSTNAIDVFEANCNGENWDDIYDTSASNSATATFTSFGASVVSNIQSSTLQSTAVTSTLYSLYTTTSSSYFSSLPQFESSVLSIYTSILPSSQVLAPVTTSLASPQETVSSALSATFSVETTSIHHEVSSILTSLFPVEFTMQTLQSSNGAISSSLPINPSIQPAAITSSNLQAMLDSRLGSSLTLSPSAFQSGITSTIDAGSNLLFDSSLVTSAVPIIQPTMNSIFISISPTPSSSSIFPTRVSSASSRSTIVPSISSMLGQTPSSSRLSQSSSRLDTAQPILDSRLISIPPTPASISTVISSMNSVSNGIPNEITPGLIPSLHYLVFNITYQILSLISDIPDPTPDPNLDTNVTLILNAISAIYNNITIPLGGEAVGISNTSIAFDSGLIRERTVTFYVVDNSTFLLAFEVKEILDRANNTDWENTIQLNDPSTQLAVINVTISCLYPCTVTFSSSQHFSILPTGSMLTTTVAATMNATQPLISTTLIPSLIQTMTSSTLLRETASTVSVSQPSLLLSTPRTIQPTGVSSRIRSVITSAIRSINTQSSSQTLDTSVLSQSLGQTQLISSIPMLQTIIPIPSLSRRFATQSTIPMPSAPSGFATQTTLPISNSSLTFSTQATIPTQSPSLTFSTQATIPTQSPSLAFVTTQAISTLLLSPSSELVTQTILSTPGLSAERSLQSSIPVLSQSSVFASQTTTPMPLPSSGVISPSSVLINPSSTQLSSSHVMTSSPSRSLSDTMILSTRPSSVFLSSMLGQTVSTLPAVETSTSAVLTPFPSLSSQTPLASISTTSPISSTLTTGWDYIQIPDFDPGVGYLLLLTVTSSNISAQSDPLFYLNTELKLINLYTIALSKNVGISVNNNRKKRDVFNTTSMLAAGIIESRSQIDSNTLKIVFYVSQGQPNTPHRFIPANESLVTYNKLVAQEYNSILTDLSFISIEIYSDPILFQTMTAIIVGSILGCCVLLLLVFLIFTVLYHCLHSTRNGKWPPERDLSFTNEGASSHFNLQPVFEKETLPRGTQTFARDFLTHRTDGFTNMSSGDELRMEAKLFSPFQTEDSLPLVGEEAGTLPGGEVSGETYLYQSRVDATMTKQFDTISQLRSNVEGERRRAEQAEDALNQMIAARRKQHPLVDGLLSDPEEVRKAEERASTVYERSKRELITGTQRPLSAELEEGQESARYWRPRSSKVAPSIESTGNESTAFTPQPKILEWDTDTAVQTNQTKPAQLTGSRGVKQHSVIPVKPGTLLKPLPPPPDIKRPLLAYGATNSNEKSIPLQSIPVRIVRSDGGQPFRTSTLNSSNGNSVPSTTIKVLPSFNPFYTTAQNDHTQL